LVLIWLIKAVKFLSILINTLWTHRHSAFTKYLPVIEISVAHLFSVLCSPIMWLDVWGSVLWFPHTNDGWFVFTSSFLQEGSCLINVICVCLRIAVSNAHCVGFFVFLFGFYCFSCVTCVACVYGLSMLCYHFSILYRLLTLAH
jgi:hypothetical protein